MSLIVGENGWNRFDKNILEGWESRGCVQNVVVVYVSILSVNKIFCVFVAGGRALISRSLPRTPHRQAESKRIIAHEV